MKLAVVGGGSTYTPELVDGIARLAGQVNVDELVLVDPDTSRLDVVGPFSARIMKSYGHPARLSWTTSLDEGLDGAGAVLLQLRVGGQAARQRDETWPLEFCCVGQETTGAGGLAKALRTVPIVLDIAERTRQRAASDAWIIDFTNPVGIVTRALLDAGHRAIGLCNVAIGFQRNFAQMLGVPPEQVALDHVGLNHLTWERAAIVDGVDRLPGLIATHGPEIAAHTCAISGRMTPWWKRSCTPRPGPRRSRRSRSCCSGCTPTRRWTGSRSCSASGAGRSTRRRPWRCSRRWSPAPGTPR